MLLGLRIGIKIYLKSVSQNYNVGFKERHDKTSS
jgi:hypothetical protein